MNNVIGSFSRLGNGKYNIYAFKIIIRGNCVTVGIRRVAFDINILVQKYVSIDFLYIIIL